ncbi:MAG: NUDIX domain-containing protein [Candidatus Paceibacterota bacterium]
MKEKSCGIIPIHRKRGEIYFLLIKHLIGHWGFPKGHMEDGETEQETALREFTEEVGIKNCEIVNGFKHSQTYYFYRKEGKIFKEVIFFLGIVRNIEDIKIQEEEISEFGWFTYSEVLEKISFESNKKMINNAIKFLEDNDV